MKIIRKPNVYLVGRTKDQEEGIFDFLRDHKILDWVTVGASDGGGDLLCEMAGRLCYMSFGKGRKSNKEYLEHIIEVGHGSVLEHSVWNFIFTGVSRSLTHELVRHRAGMGYSQLSQRYVDESVAEYVEPDVIVSDPEAHQIWESAVAYVHEAYKQLSARLLTLIERQTHRETAFGELEGMTFEEWKANLPSEVKTSLRKQARQAARSVLPNATETKIFVTMNTRAARHFIEMRCSRHADVEIRKLAGKVWEILVREAPNLFSDYRKEMLPDGTFELITPNRKV